MRTVAAAGLVFVGGFIIMVLEIIGARFLAKDFGSSFYVWVSQIGVILIALALGYGVGGALADRPFLRAEYFSRDGSPDHSSSGRLFFHGSLVCCQAFRSGGDCRMKRRFRVMFLILTAQTLLAGPAVTVFETTSAYHHILVTDQDGIRALSFDGSMETRMSLRDPLQGIFDKPNIFIVPWIWNQRLTNVLMVGLGGASTQRAYAHYYPYVTVETVEIDPAVLRVATEFFH